MALLLNFTVSSGMPLVQLWLIALTIYAFENGEMSISQKRGIISLIGTLRTDMVRRGCSTGANSENHLR